MFNRRNWKKKLQQEKKKQGGMQMIDAVELCYLRAVGSERDRQVPPDVPTTATTELKTINLTSPTTSDQQQQVNSTSPLRAVAQKSKFSLATDNDNDIVQSYQLDPRTDAQHLVSSSSSSSSLKKSENLIPELAELRLYYSLTDENFVPKPTNGAQFPSTTEKNELFRKSSQISPFTTTTKTDRKLQQQKTIQYRGGKSAYGPPSFATNADESLVEVLELPPLQSQQESISVQKRSLLSKGGRMYGRRTTSWYLQLLTYLKQVLLWLLYMMYLIPNPNEPYNY